MNDDDYDAFRDKVCNDPLWAADEIGRLRAELVEIKRAPSLDMSRMERRKLGLPDDPISADDFATFMADVVANNPTREGAREDGLKLMAAVLSDLGYAEGVLIYGQMSEWYPDE